MGGWIAPGFVEMIFEKRNSAFDQSLMARQNRLHTTRTHPGDDDNRNTAILHVHRHMRTREVLTCPVARRVAGARAGCAVPMMIGLRLSQRRQSIPPSIPHAKPLKHLGIGGPKLTHYPVFGDDVGVEDEARHSGVDGAQARAGASQHGVEVVPPLLAAIIRLGREPNEPSP